MSVRMKITNTTQQNAVKQPRRNSSTTSSRAL